MVQANYLSVNPLAMDRRRKKRNQSKPKIIDRYLESDEIHAVLNTLHTQPIKTDTQQFQVIRVRYIILFYCYFIRVFVLAK